MTTAERGTYTATSALTAANKGITIFNTTTNRYDYWDGTQWLQMAAISPTSSDFIQNQTAASQTANFRISGLGIFGNGTAGAPSVTFEGSQTTGLYRSGADILSISTASTERVRVGATGVVRLTNYASGMLGVNASGDVQTRSIAVSATGVDVTNGDGVAGNPTLNLNYANSSTGGKYPQGNFGQFEAHGTYTDFNSVPGHWGWNYVTSTANAPNATSSQWYRGVFSLGSNYPARGANGYSLELAYPRYSGATAGVWMRTVENGAIGSWIRIDAGTNNNNFIWNQTAADQAAGLRVTGNALFNGGQMTIGTATPAGAYKLTIAGAAASTFLGTDNDMNWQAKNAGGTYEFFMTPRGGDNVTYLNYGSVGMNIRNNSSASTMFMQNGGNVGLNNTNPAQRLHVGAGAGDGVIIGNYNDQLGWGGGGANPEFAIRFAGYRDVVNNFSGAKISAIRTNLCCGGLSQGMELAFSTQDNTVATSGGDGNLTERVRIGNGGNLGVGTTTPAQKLHVVGTGRFTTLANASNRMVYANSTGDLAVSTSDINPNALVDGAGTLNYLARWTPDGNTLSTGVTFDNGTNVGISTTTPGQKLDVNGGIRSLDYGAAGSVNVMVGDDTYFTDIDVGNMVGLYSASSAAVGGLRLGNTGGAYIYGATDNIGVGNTAPSHKLHVTGDIWAEGRFVVQNSTDGGATRGIRMWNAGDSNWGIYMGQSGGGRSMSGGTATAGGGFTALAIRFRVNNDGTQGFIFENSAESNLLSIRGDNGRATFKGGVFFDCNSCGDVGTVDGSANWGDLTIQGRVVSTNSNLHLSPPGGSRVVINSSYRAAGGAGGTTGLDIEDGGIRMRKNYRWINRYGSTGGYGWGSQTHNLGAWDFCAVGHVGFRNTNSATDEDDDVQCAVYPNAHADAAEGTLWDSYFTYQFNAKPNWYMYLEGYADTNATNCAAMCMNHE